jgi:hypothetical protein
VLVTAGFILIQCYFGRQVNNLERSFRSPGMPNGFRSAHMSHTERLDEMAHLLALGYLRLRARCQTEKTNDPNHLREFALDFVAEGSVCDTDTHADRERV